MTPRRSGPNGNGTALARRLRATRPDLAVLLVTGYADDRDLEGFPALTKPFTPETLLRKLRELLAHGRNG